MKVTILGSGGSAGVPAAGNFWGACDPNNPKNKRDRASILVQSETTNILVDASYDVRHQLNSVEGLKHLDALLLSHHHSDHINGLDDLRVLAYTAEKPIDVYADPATISEILRRWPYVVATDSDVYRPFLEMNPFEFYDEFDVADIHIKTFEQDHLTCSSSGYRFNDFAYCVDVANLNEKSLEKLKGIETWVVDCCAYTKEKVSTHANLQRVMEWIDILKPKMTYLTVLTPHFDHKVMCDELPPHIRPAYDGLEIEGI